MSAELRAEFAAFVEEFKAKRPHIYGKRAPYVRQKPDLAAMRASLEQLRKELRSEDQYGNYAEAMEYYRISTAIHSLEADIRRYEQELQQ